MMNTINWKEISACPGYKSLKAAYIEDVQEAALEIRKGRKPMRDKAEFYKHFRKIISMAFNHAHYTGESVIDLLNKWEKTENHGS